MDHVVDVDFGGNLAATLASVCIEALEEALARFGKPDIFNTDQGSQFTMGKN